jgi:hypothetical protein
MNKEKEIVKMRFSRGIFLTGICFIFAFSILGCHAKIHVSPVPEQSEIFLDGKNVGTGYTKLSLPNLKGRTYHLKVQGPAGYLSAEKELNIRTSRNLTIKVPKDNSYFDTENVVEVVNKWIVIKSDKHYSDEKVWRKIVSSVTTAVSDFQVLDQKSMYLKSAWQFAGKGEDVTRIRSRIIVGIDNPEKNNLTFKFRIESERVRNNGAFIKKSTRTFRAFLDALETTRSRVEHYSK